MATVTILITSGTTFAVPIDFNPSNNTVEAVGTGGGSGSGFATGVGGAGGAGGEGGGYAKVNNLNLIPGSVVACQVSAGSAATNGPDAWISNTGVAPTTTSQGVLAKGGAGGANATGAFNATGQGVVGAARTTSGQIGSTVAAGGVSTQSPNSTLGGSGGGGAGGPNGPGGTGAASSGNYLGGGGGGGNNGGNASTQTGGTNRSGSGAGVAGTPGTAGTNGGGGGGASRGGTEPNCEGGKGSQDVIWTQTSDSATAGPGGGSGGSSYQNPSGTPSGNGVTPLGWGGGASGGAGSVTTAGVGVAGATGGLAITYTPTLPVMFLRKLRQYDPTAYEIFDQPKQSAPRVVSPSPDAPPLARRQQPYVPEQEYFQPQRASQLATLIPAGSAAVPALHSQNIPVVPEVDYSWYPPAKKKPVISGVREVQHTSGSGNPFTLTLTGVTTGNCLVVALANTNGLDGPTTVYSISDDKGNTYTPVVRSDNPVAQPFVTLIAVASNVTGGTVHVTVSGGATTAVLWECAGADQFSPVGATSFDFSVSTSGDVDSGSITSIEGALYLTVMSINGGLSPTLRCEGWLNAPSSSFDGTLSVRFATLAGQAAGTYEAVWRQLGTSGFNGVVIALVPSTISTGTISRKQQDAQIQIILPEYNYLWYEQVRLQPNPVTFLPTPFPQQRSQRIDPLPDYTYRWYEQFRIEPFPATFVVTPFLKQKDQTIIVLPEYNYQWYEQTRIQPNPETFLPTPFPRQHSQDIILVPDENVRWWDQIHSHQTVSYVPEAPPTHRANAGWLPNVPNYEDLWWQQYRHIPIIPPPPPPDTPSLKAASQVIFAEPEIDLSYWHPRRLHPLPSYITSAQEGTYSFFTVVATACAAGSYRVANDIAGYNVYVGVETLPDLTHAPYTFTRTTPINIPWPLPASGTQSLYVVVRQQNQYGIESNNQYSTKIILTHTGVTVTPTGSPTNVRAVFFPSISGIRLSAQYPGFSTDKFPADQWWVWIGSSPPDGTAVPSLKVSAENGAALQADFPSLSPGTYYFLVGLYRFLDNTMQTATAKAAVPANPGKVLPVISGFEKPLN